MVRLVLEGIPLWQRQLGILERAGARPVLLGLRARQRSFGDKKREIRDRQTDAGPLSGLQVALSALAKAQWVAVLAVDMPHVGSAWFRRLRARCRPGVGAVVVHPEGYEPLAAIYPLSALPVVVRRLKAGKLALQGLVAELVREGQMIALPLPKGEGWRMANWNEPGDVEQRRDH